MTPDSRHPTLVSHRLKAPEGTNTYPRHARVTSITNDAFSYLQALPQKQPPVSLDSRPLTGLMTATRVSVGSKTAFELRKAPGFANR